MLDASRSPVGATRLVYLPEPALQKQYRRHYRPMNLYFDRHTPTRLCMEAARAIRAVRVAGEQLKTARKTLPWPVQASASKRPDISKREYGVDILVWVVLPNRWWGFAQWQNVRQVNLEWAMGVRAMN